MAVSAPTTLLNEIRELSSAFKSRLSHELSVNSTDLEAMEHLIQDGALSPTELARRLALTTAAVTTIVDRLAALGHVSRVPNPADRRGVLVVPTAASVARAMATLMPMVLGIDRALDEFSAAERETITRYLEKVVAAYRLHVTQ